MGRGSPPAEPGPAGGPPPPGGPPPLGGPPIPPPGGLPMGGSARLLAFGPWPRCRVLPLLVVLQGPGPRAKHGAGRGGSGAALQLRPRPVAAGALPGLVAPQYAAVLSGRDTAPGLRGCSSKRTAGAAGSLAASWADGRRCGGACSWQAGRQAGEKGWRIQCHSDPDEVAVYPAKQAC